MPLDVSSFNAIRTPAIIGRLSARAASSDVFRSDSTYGAKLGKRTAAEADKRLADRLTRGSSEGGPTMNRFELTDTLRAQARGFMPRGSPWDDTINPVDAARVLESFLIEDAAAGKPDYTLLKQFDADAVLEITIEEYGMRSANGTAGVFVTGNARLVRLDGGLLYQRRFFSDEVKAGFEALDPFEVEKKPSLFRERLKRVLTAVAEQIALDVTPSSGR
jgi:hypothetical protein